MCDKYATHACLCTPMKGCQKSEETELTGACHQQCCENAAKAAPCMELLLLVLIHLPGVALLKATYHGRMCSKKPRRLPGARPGHGRYVCRAIERRASHESCKGIQA